MELLRKRPSTGQGRTILRVVSFQSHSASCMSNRRTSAKNLAELPAFRAAIQGTQNKVASEALLKHVVADVHGIGGLSHAKVQRARDLATRRTTAGSFVRLAEKVKYPYTLIK